MVLDPNTGKNVTVKGWGAFGSKRKWVLRSRLMDFKNLFQACQSMSLLVFMSFSCFFLPLSAIFSDFVTQSAAQVTWSAAKSRSAVSSRSSHRADERRSEIFGVLKPFFCLFFLFLCVLLVVFSFLCVFFVFWCVCVFFKLVSMGPWTWKGFRQTWQDFFHPPSYGPIGHSGQFFFVKPVKAS